MNIGKFRYDPIKDSFVSERTILQRIVTSLRIEPVKKQTANNGPDYLVFDQGDYGLVEVGAGWKRKSGQGRNYISVCLDAPHFTAPINARLFTDKDSNTASMLWSRDNSKTSKADAA